MATAATREAVKVAVRCRPMSEKETSKNFQNIVRVDQSNSSIYIRNPQSHDVQFTYDFVFPENSSQEEIYENTAAPIISGVLDGINGTIFAYGQTGTGKTFTMDGKSHGDLRGIVPRAFEHIFDFITTHQDTHKFSVTVTYVELYKEQIRDLLSTEESNLTLHEDPSTGFQIHGVAIHTVKTIEDLRKIQKFGKKRRKTRKTDMNDESSRSHSILSINIETLTEIEGSQHVRKGRLNLVDLAGSERVEKTNVQKDGLIEAVNINFALMVLGNCISALTTKGTTHIPFRDSNLTKLLRDSLGGNAKTLMIAAIGPADFNFSESMATLRYAERAKKIKNKPKVNMDPKDALLVQYQEELAALQSQLDSNVGAQVGMSEDVIHQMEEKLEEQKKQLAAASNLAKEEREQLQKKLDARMKKIEKEKAKQSQYLQRLEEMNKYLVNGGKALMSQTVKNEAEINSIREKLRQREEHSKKLGEELQAKKEKKRQMLEQCTTVQAKVDVISREFSDSAAKYKNLKLKLPEVQKTIQEDRESISREVDNLTQQIEVFNLIIDNFVPQSEVERVRSIAVLNKTTMKYEKQEMDKKALLKKVMERQRPKSAYGFGHPSIVGGKKLGRLQADDSIKGDLPVVPIENKLRDGPQFIEMDGIEEEIEKAFEDNETDLEVEIPQELPGVGGSPVGLRRMSNGH